MNIVNLTPHELVLYSEDQGEGMRIPSAGVARCAETRTVVDRVMGLPIYETQFGEISGLPDPAPDTIFVVSALVAKAAGRDDVFAPGPAIRDAEGRVIGAVGLSRIS